MKFPSFIKRHPIAMSFVFAIFIVTVSFSLRVKAGRALGIAPFGGRILSVQYCPCSWNLAITVGPPVGGVFTYEPGFSTVRAFYQIFRPGPWVLGTYVPGGSCLTFCHWCCMPANFPIGTIDEVGTSM